MSEFFSAFVEFSFIRNAMLAGILASVASGVVGTFVVTRRITVIAQWDPKLAPHRTILSYPRAFRTSFTSSAASRTLKPRRSRPCASQNAFARTHALLIDAVRSLTVTFRSTGSS